MRALTHSEFEDQVEDTPVPWPIPFSLQVYTVPAKKIQTPAQLWCWGTTEDTWRDKGSPGTQICPQCLSE